MKKLLIILNLLIVSTYSFAQSEEESITKSVNDFLEGGTNGDVARFKGAFFSDAVQKSIGKNGLIGMTVDALSAKIKPNEKLERTTKLISLSYAGIAATATTETEYPTSKIIDFLNLLKVGDSWKIISRVYSRIEKDENVASTGNSSKGSAGKSNTTSGKTATPAKPKKAAVSSDGW